MLWARKSPKDPKDSKETQEPKESPSENGLRRPTISSREAKVAPDPERSASHPLPELRRIVDDGRKDDTLLEKVVDGTAADSTESSVRYAAYATRIRTILTSAHRYVAYTSDIGESFRPVAHPNYVRAAYGISWAYIVGDVGYEGYKAYLHNRRSLDPTLALTPAQEAVLARKTAELEAHAVKTNGAHSGGHTGGQNSGAIAPIDDYRTVMAQRAIFQSLASMGLPAFTIHSVVRYSGRAMRDVKIRAVRMWAPIGLGLAVVPFLPTLFDKPVENAVEWVFHRGFELYGGRDYVGDAPSTGREELLMRRPGKGEKEL